jgi:trehalose 6-phosphate phosphatase
METILDSSMLTRLTRSDLLVAFDFDGTLAPIVDRPEDAAMRPRTRRLLARVAQLYPCAVVSGRAEADLLRLLGGVTVWYVVGNRFLDPPESASALTPVVERWRSTLAACVDRLPGTWLEDKGTSIAVHYRSATDRERARETLLSAALLLESVRVVPGKEVVNFLPRTGPSKGIAVDRLRRQIACGEVLYVGDDESDEEVFAVPGISGVRVGRVQSHARHCLASQEEVDELLGQLIDARDRPALKPEAPRPGSGLGFLGADSIAPPWRRG